MKKSLIIILLISISIILSTLLFGNDDVVSCKIIPQEVKVGEIGTIEVTFEIPDGMHCNKQEDYFFIEAEGAEGIKFYEVEYPAGEELDGIIAYHGQVTLAQNFTVSKGFESGKQEIKVLAGYQFCDDIGTCFFPEEIEFVMPITIGNAGGGEQIAQKKIDHSIKSSPAENNFSEIEKLLDDFEVSGITGGYKKSDEFITFLDEAATSGSLNSNTFSGKKLWLIILLILIGGIALNLTPCVLPMIPITIAVLGAGTQAESKGRGLLIGATYGLGMTLAYGTLGLVVVLTGSRFGAINSSPVFNIIIAAVFMFLALAMFDVIPIDFSKFGSGKVGKKSKGKFITVFILGVVAAILAGACIAPVLISVILYSTTLYAKGNSIGLLLPFLLGAGMAIPWPFAGAGLTFLPKPGRWMDWVKYIFGVIIFVIAIYYGYSGIKIIKSNAKTFEQTEVSHEESNLPWIYSLSKGLKKAKIEGKPVLIDFWATWCKNCIVMDATTYRDEEVVEILDDYILVKYVAENLQRSPTKEILDYFNIVGLPSYVILTPK
ncbi:MAG: cytochrome c biogenesis protein CcdA [Candidatus Cloacimonadota bacterium]|nr:cytochrome c biogenesis protein CcdA [Candidatus Cloacimonadota bacterium]